MARRQAGLTQQALAELAGTSQAAVSAYESGRRSPSVDTLSRLLGAAGYDARKRLAPPDTHVRSLTAAEALLPSDQLERHSEREQARLAQHPVDA